MKKKKLKIFFFVQDISKESGGLGSAVMGLFNSLENKKIEVHIFTSSILDEKNILKNFQSKIIFLNSKNFLSSLRNINVIYKFFLKNPPDLVHLHGLWKPIPFLGYIFSKIKKIKFVLSPHGMLMPYAVKQKKLKKKLALFLFQRKIIKDAKTIITASSLETLAVRNFNSNIPIECIPHGIKSPKRITKSYSSKNKIALFLGRIHPTKGIKELLEIWSKLNLPNWELIISGTCDDKIYFGELKKLAAGNKNNIFFHGPAFGSKKEKLFNKADLFILPTKTENFGITILEAMTYQVPVITTKNAPWQIIKDNSIGWWITDSKNELKKAIIEATSMNIKNLRKMGKDAKNLIKEKYSWEEISLKYLELYNKSIK